ncbi:glycosyltransferase family 1 protein [Bradyrhizobium sp. SZCCHNRI3037]|uniref:glycosyltransferase family 1 protein n=1 Tax=Bradyrhizobium sp. SZCCHNRI3037 TaxID=3057290 RepID=UPI00291614C2|nr:glycosyltransferase family 1 protein [Bradyrhizobium sp. SZCCHNRI3037]
MIVLIVIEGEIATTALIEQVVGACRKHDISYRKCFLWDLKSDDFLNCDLPLFVRCGDPLAMAWAKALRRAGRPYAYYIDDNFWAISGDGLLAAYYRHPAVRRSIEFLASQAAVVITNSIELARTVGRFNSSVSVLPSFFDFSLVEGNESHCHHAVDEVRIGFAGSPSRAPDLEIVKPIIGELLRDYPNVAFEFIGAAPSGVVAIDRVRIFPHLLDYKSYVRFQLDRAWSIGLAPLVDNEANRAKTDNKYREYGAFGYAGIYSAIPPYIGVVADGVTGTLVDDRPSSWSAALRRLIENSEVRTSIACAAFKDVRERYEVSRVAEDWARLFRALVHQAPASKAAVQIGRERHEALFDRYRLHVEIIRQQGGWSLVIYRVARKALRALARLFV